MADDKKSEPNAGGGSQRVISGTMNMARERGRTQFGVVALLDALGFKGIWKHYDAGDVAHVLDAPREILRSSQEALKEIQQETGVHLRHYVISDTIALAAVVDVPLNPDERSPHQREVVGAAAG